MLKDLQSAGRAGEYYTPRAVTNFVVEKVNPKLGETVLDPACGTGGFLTSTIAHFGKILTTEDWNTMQTSIKGWEKKPLPYLLATTNLILHDIEVPQLEHKKKIRWLILSMTIRKNTALMLFLQIRPSAAQKIQESKKIFQLNSVQVRQLIFSLC